MTELFDPPAVDIVDLRASIRIEYAAVASEPERGFHFHTGPRLAAILGYPQEWIKALPPRAAASMAGTGNRSRWVRSKTVSTSSIADRAPARMPSSPRGSSDRKAGSSAST
jgi:hypothetical protein